MKRLFLSLIFVSGLSYGAYYFYQYGEGSTELIRSEDAMAAQRKLCTGVLKEIQGTADCSEKRKLFQKNRSECTQLSLVTKEEVLIYDDFIFEVAECFRKSGQRAQYEELLHEISDGKVWQREGPTQCPIEEEAEARLEATNYPDDECLKDENLGSWIGKGKDVSTEALIALSSRDHVIRFGTWGSDDSCVLPFQKFAQVAGEMGNMKVTDVQKEEDDTRYVYLQNANAGKNLVLGFVVEDSCLVLHGVYLGGAKL